MMYMLYMYFNYVTLTIRNIFVHIECLMIALSTWRYASTNISITVFADINECKLVTTDCDQTCVNTIGGYSCSCNDGYTLNNDNVSCSGKFS